VKDGKSSGQGEAQDPEINLTLTDEASLSTDELVERINELSEKHVGGGQIVVGTLVLNNVFGSDLKTALSKNPRKKTSFRAICEHKKLRVSAATLTSWVRVAAANQELEVAGQDTSSLLYSQLRELCKLPDAATRVEVTRKIREQQLTVEATIELVKATLAEAAAADAKDEPRLGNIAKVMVKGLKDPLSLPDNATIMGFLEEGDAFRNEFRVGEMAEIISKTREARRELVQQKKRLDRRLGPITRSVTVLDQILDIFDDSEEADSKDDEDH
jgi:hypothetical protein